jgi:hypothetical protein
MEAQEAVAVVEVEAEEVVAVQAIAAVLVLAQVQALGHTATKLTYHIDRSK